MDSAHETHGQRQRPPPFDAPVVDAVASRPVGGPSPTAGRDRDRVGIVVPPAAPLAAPGAARVGWGCGGVGPAGAAACAAAPRRVRR